MKLKFVFIFVILNLLSCTKCLIKKDHLAKELPFERALEYAQKNLPKEGYLVQNPDGYAYIKVDDRYIDELYPLLKVENEGFTKPPFFRRKDSPGAHISVFYKDEHVMAKEIGKKFNFSLKRIETVKVNKHKSFIVLTVEAQALEKLRKSYNLAPLLQGNEFHISLAKKIHKNSTK